MTQDEVNSEQRQSPREVTLVRSDYQPTKAEREEPITLPEGTTPEDIAKALTRPVDIRWTPRPE